MTENQNSIPYSVLDLALVTESHTISNAIQNSRELAIQAEDAGYKRIWLAEHHNMENIASSATSILLGYLGEATKSIRIGSGGVMLPNHSPLIIAEQFGTLATLYPDRVDLGLGRAPGTDQATAYAIRPDRMTEVHRFPENVKLLQRYLSADNRNASVRAIPGEGTNIPLWILGSSTDSAFLAATLGLPYVFASHFAPQQLISAIQIYRDNFKPSIQLDQPYIMPTINVIVADTDQQAAFLSTSMKQMFMGVITGERKPMPPPIDDMRKVWSEQQKMMVDQMLSCSFIGSNTTVIKELTEFLNQTQANEIMIASYVYDQNERLKSHRLFAELMGELAALNQE
ncbi:MAG: LLM class flavin-dependent oxidoreductase [Balneolales bacterium]